MNIKSLMITLAGIALPVSLAAQPPIHIIPQPASVEATGDTFTFENVLTYSCPKKFSRALVLGLNRAPFKLHGGIDDLGKLTILEDKTLTQQGYHLSVTKEKIIITASTSTGVFYACQTLMQLMPPAVFAPGKKPQTVTIPAVEIKDKPRFAWRGLMLDSSRHFQTVDEIKRFIDNMAIHKLNVFHWHLTDGHGWRFESKKYPNLTKKGAWRMQPGYPTKGKTERYGGFYTQEQMKDVVAYAKARSITIIPEIDMPGHCFALVAAYPECGCLQQAQDTDRFYTYPADAQRFPSIKGTDVLCVSRAKTLKMCKDILDEVMEIFPAEYIHIGGDEVQKKFWKNCKSCQGFIKKKKLHGEHGLQSWFIQQLDNYITSKGRNLIGWDEILEGGLAKNATVMSWQGEQGGIKAAKMGHDVVMSPQTYIYLDHGQSHSPLEPPHWPGHKPLDRAYNYEPIPASLTAKQAKHILGVQGNVWTVFVHEEWLLDLVTWPRAAAIAEVGWSPKEKRNWDDFYKRLSQTHRKRLDALNINYWWENSRTLGAWSPADLKLNNEVTTLTYDVSKQLSSIISPTTQKVNLTWNKGGHGLAINSVALYENNTLISEDKHDGFTGAKHENNTYSIKIKEFKKDKKYTVRVTAYSDGGVDSHGTVTMSSVETKVLKKLPWQ